MRYRWTTSAPSWDRAAWRSQRRPRTRCARPTRPLSPSSTPRRQFAWQRPQGHLHGAARPRVPRARRPPQPVAALPRRRHLAPLRRGRACSPRRERRRSPGSSRCCPSSWPWRPRTPTPTAASDRETGRPRTATWGVGNYSCALRAVLDHPESARLELRIPGADTSPHHCLAMFLGAALWGIEERLDPPPPVIAPADGRDARRWASAPPRPCRGGGPLRETARRPASCSARPSWSTTPPARRAEAAACHRFVSTEERERYVDYV